MVQTRGLPRRTRRALITILLVVLIAHMPSAQAPPESRAFEGAIGAGATWRHTVLRNAGDVTVGTLELKGAPGVLLVTDPKGRKFVKNPVSEPDPAAFGFLSETSGEYSIQVVSKGPRDGTYALRYRVRRPDSAASIVVAPTVRYQSARVTQLTNELKAVRPDALARFWVDAAAANGTFVDAVPNDDQNVLATFVWRQTFETYNVRLIRPPENKTAMDYYLTRLPGTDVWYKTMKVHRSTRFGYAFSPNYIPDEANYVSVSDPLNSNLFPGDIDHSDWTPDSVFVAPGAPDDTWATITPGRRGTVTERTFDSTLLKARIELAVYTPDGFSNERGQYPLLMLFNGPAYDSDVVAAPRILDNLIAAGRIRPVVVCFVSNETSSADGAADLRFNPVFADAIANELVPWLRHSFAVSADASEHVVGGFSIGANAAFFLALRHSEVFGNVLSQDGAGGVGRQLPQMFIDAPKKPFRAYMAHSLYNLPQTSLDEVATMKDAQGSSARLRDVLRAKGNEVTYVEYGGTTGSTSVRRSRTR